MTIKPFLRITSDLTNGYTCSLFVKPHIVLGGQQVSIDLYFWTPYERSIYGPWVHLRVIHLYHDSKCLTTILFCLRLKYETYILLNRMSVHISFVAMLEMSSDLEKSCNYISFQCGFYRNAFEYCHTIKLSITK